MLRVRSVSRFNVTYSYIRTKIDVNGIIVQVFVPIWLHKYVTHLAN